MSELLTAEQVNHYDRLGWLKVDQLVQGDDLTRLREVVIEADSQGNSRVETKREVYKYRTEDQYTRTFRLSADVWTDYPELLELARQLAPAACQVLHADGVRLYADRLFIKPPTSAGGLPTAWHQDLPKLPFDRRDNVTIWVAVEDIPADKGPLTFLSGSHRLGPVAAMNYDSDEEMFVRLSPYERATMTEIVEVPLKQATRRSTRDSRCTAPAPTSALRSAWSGRSRTSPRTPSSTAFRTAGSKAWA